MKKLIVQSLFVTVVFMFLLASSSFAVCPPVHYAVGEGPWCVVAVDLNDDSMPDLITANVWDKNLTIRFNDGEGDFPESERVDFELGYFPYWLAVADLNNDDLNDIAVAGMDTVSILINKKTNPGEIDPSKIRHYQILCNNFGIFAAKLDDDDYLDLVVVTTYCPPSNFDLDSNVTILLNNDDSLGTFTIDTVFDGGTGCWAVYVADFDTNGTNDLVIANDYGADIRVFTNDGYANFQLDSIYSFGSRAVSAFAADFNDDDCPDLATTCDYDAEHNGLWVFLNKGNGKFDSPTRYMDGSQLGWCFAADLDNDQNGNIDLLVGMKTGQYGFALVNDGSGDFDEEHWYSCLAASPVGSWAEDLDDNDYKDLIFSADLDEKITVFYSEGDIQFIRGDCDSSFIVNIVDVVYLVNYLFKSGPAPKPLLSGDVDCNSEVNVTDLTALINYVNSQIPFADCGCR